MERSSKLRLIGACRSLPSLGTSFVDPPASASPSWGRFFLPAAAYLTAMRSVAFEPCIPTRGTKGSRRISKTDQKMCVVKMKSPD